MVKHLLSSCRYRYAVERLNKLMCAKAFFARAFDAKDVETTLAISAGRAFGASLSQPQECLCHVRMQVGRQRSAHPTSARAARTFAGICGSPRHTACFCGFSGSPHNRVVDAVSVMSCSPRRRLQFNPGLKDAVGHVPLLDTNCSSHMQQPDSPEHHPSCSGDLQIYSCFSSTHGASSFSCRTTCMWHILATSLAVAVSSPIFLCSSQWHAPCGSLRRRWAMLTICRRAAPVLWAHGAGLCGFAAW